MNTLCAASNGLMPEFSTQGVATNGLLCLQVVVQKKGGGRNPLVYRSWNITDPSDEIPIEQLVREDEEVIAVLIAGIQIGLIK